MIGLIAAAWQQPMLVQSAMAEPPKFQVDPAWPQPLPDKWIIGVIGGIFVDSTDQHLDQPASSSLDAREKTRVRQRRT